MTLCVCVCVCVLVAFYRVSEVSKQAAWTLPG